MAQPLLFVFRYISALTVPLAGLILLAGGAGRLLPPPYLMAFDSNYGLTYMQDIFLLDVARRLPVNLTRSPLSREYAAAIAPGGLRVAYTTSRDETWGIYLWDTNRHSHSRLTDQPLLNGAPDWSPDGNWLVFASSPIEAPFNVYALDMETGVVRRITNSATQDIDPAWSPDGQYIVYSSGEGGYFSLLVMEVNCAGECRISDSQRLTGTNNYDLAPVWSPDGERIAFISIRGGIEMVLLLHTACLEADTCVRQNSRILAGIDRAVFPKNLSWSPDGQTVLVQSEAGDWSDIYAVDAACQQPRGCPLARLTDVRRSFPLWRVQLLPEG